MFPGAQFTRGIQPEYLPPFYLGFQDLTPGLNLFNLGASMQQIGAVIAVATSWSLLQEEINKFFWWPFHLSSYLLILGPIPPAHRIEHAARAAVSRSISDLAGSRSPSPA